MRPLAPALLLAALGLAACAGPGAGTVPASPVAAAPTTGLDAVALPDLASASAGADASAMLPPAY